MLLPALRTVIFTASLLLLPRGRAVDPNSCWYLKGQTLLANDRLYFRGDVDAIGDTNDYLPSNRLHWLQLNTSFPVEGPISDRAVHSSSSLNTTNSLEYGGFWIDRDQKLLYLANGLSNDSILAFKHEDDTWLDVPVSGGTSEIKDLENAMLVSSSEGGGSKSFGASGPTTGMSVLDTTEPQSPTWTNLDNAPYLWSATSQYVRFGTQGVIVAVGGNASDSTLRDMSLIQIFDIESQTWFQISANGIDIPKPRIKFCSVISAAPDDSSFQMTIYGGQNLDLEIGFKDTYVLTMPAFLWIKIEDKGNIDPLGRMRHHCHVYNDRQMIVVGGEFWDGSNKSYPSYVCNDTFSSVKLLDTTTYEWQKQFPLRSNDTTYTVPQAVFDVIGGNASGGAKLAKAWGHTGGNLDIFGKVIPKYGSDATSSVSSTTTATSQPGANESKPNIAAIAGGASAGAVALLLLLGTLGLVYIRKRRRGKKHAETLGSSEKPELSSDNTWIPLAKERPTYQTLELKGDSPQNLGPGFRRELMDTGYHELEAPTKGGGVS